MVTSHCKEGNSSFCCFVRWAATTIVWGFRHAKPVQGAKDTAQAKLSCRMLAAKDFEHHEDSETNFFFLGNF